MHFCSKIIIRWTILLVCLTAAPIKASELLISHQNRHPLIQAIKLQNKLEIKALLNQGTDVNQSEQDGATALHWAAYWDDFQTIKRLISEGANVNATNDLMITPLALAGANGNAIIVKSLLNAGADPDAGGETGITPLMEAARTGSLDAVRVLLEFGANVTAHTNDRWQTALMWAVAQKHPDVVELLLKFGANPHARTRTRHNLVMLDRGPREYGVKSREVGTEINAGGITPLLFAAQVGDLKSSRLLIQAGAEINETGSNGNSPLVVATLSGQPRLAALFLQQGADPNSVSGGYTALHAAVLRSDLETVKVLLTYGANPDLILTKGSPVRRNGSQWALSSAWGGATPLCLAASYLELEIMGTLISNGASVESTLLDGTTSLLVASGITVERRLNRPLDHMDTSTDIGDDCCDRPEDRVLKAVEILLNAGSNINEVNLVGNTPLHAAASNGYSNLIQLLVDRGAKLDVQNGYGETPLALTQGKMGRDGKRKVSPELKKAGELLRKLGARD